MHRRSFMAATGALGAAAFAAPARTQEEGGQRMYYELREYHYDSEEQREGMDRYLQHAAIPAFNRIGIEPVGVFLSTEGDPITYLLLPHRELKTLAESTQMLLADPAFRQHGYGVLETTAEEPAYRRIKSSLLHAFEGMPQVERPSNAEGRIFQLRIYESPSVLTGQKKIEMFNRGEIDIFRKTGLDPVFFGQSIVGDKIPNLTYMLGFDSQEALDAAWETFKQDPDWLALSSKPEYANEKILSGITNIVLKPAHYSQI